MLKIPRVSYETMDYVCRKVGFDEENREQLRKNVEKMVEEFASEQASLMSIVANFDNMGKSGYIGVAAVVWKAIKTECENSELNSWMDKEKEKK